MKNKVLTLDVYLSFPGACGADPVVSGMSPQEAFNLLHMPAMSEYVVDLVPNWVESNVPAVPETANAQEV
ncbi:hypothetical protein [Mailhella massiliensis]|uniref:hypothetical protein n=1 Tax=Mailhella massiliensis TaxID=1903261 RepID=UPI0023F05907|nr:hypothetical protein [Mailhella massiliensis]